MQNDPSGIHGETTGGLFDVECENSSLTFDARHERRFYHQENEKKPKRTFAAGISHHASISA